MSLYFACRQAMQRARNLGPLSLNRVPDLKARGINARFVDGNKISYATRADRERYQAVAESFDQFRDRLTAQVRMGGNAVANAAAIIRQGLLVERMATHGNCGEMSAVAFRYLTQQSLTGLVGFMEWDGGNHEFVVAGLPSGLTRGTWIYDSDAAPAAWGSGAVWCDPWAGNCFDAAKPVPWRMYTREILKKTMPAIITDGDRHATSFTLVAVSQTARKGP